LRPLKIKDLIKDRGEYKQLLVNETVKMKWNTKNRVWFEDKGYIFNDYGEYFIAETRHLQLGSGRKVKISCDLCGQIKEQVYNRYIKTKNDDDFYCCVDCSKNPDVIDERKTLFNEASLERLNAGVVKRKQYYLDNYGVENPSQLDSIKQKKRDTCMKNYGVEYPIHSEVIAERMRQTNLERYGVEYAQQNEDVRSRTMKTLYENGTTKTSKQQRYIHSLLGGELNYAIRTINLDIAYPQDLVYIEYNGGGHRLRVKLGAMTQDQFDKWTRKRWYVLMRRGWKEIRIETQKDFLPPDDVLFEMIHIAYEHFGNCHTWIEFNIDEECIKTSVETVDFDYGDLRMINRYGDLYDEVR